MLAAVESNGLTVSAVCAKLKNWDFERVKSYLRDKGGECADLDQIEEEYKRFIALSVTHRERLPISSAIDAFWHAHILFTRDYRRMCTHIGVAYIDHSPTTSREERAALRSLYEDNTLRLYAKHFGAPVSKYWPQGSQLCDSNGDCTDCEYSP